MATNNNDVGYREQKREQQAAIAPQDLRKLNLLPVCSSSTRHPLGRDNDIDIHRENGHDKEGYTEQEASSSIIGGREKTW
jgi:hypothetical protein